MKGSLECELLACKMAPWTDLWEPHEATVSAKSASVRVFHRSVSSSIDPCRDRVSPKVISLLPKATVCLIVIRIRILIPSCVFKEISLPYKRVTLIRAAFAFIEADG